MRNLKKFLAVFVAVAVMLTAMVPAFAETSYVYEEEANILYDLGLYKGISETEFVPDLGKAVNREEGTVMLARLLGLVDEVEAMTAEEVAEALSGIKDAAEISEWAKPYVAYGVVHGLINGYPDGTFQPKTALSGKMYATLIMRQLGYVDVDYTNAAYELADVGGLTASQAQAFSEKDLIKDDLVGMSYGALNAMYVDGKTMIEVLVEEGVVSEDKAAEYGLIEKEEEVPLTFEAVQTGMKVIKVTFNRALTEEEKAAAKITVKRGAYVYSLTPAWNDDNTEVTLTNGVDFTAGTVTISVDGIEGTKNIVLANSTVARIDIVNNDVQLINNAVIEHKVYNQFGEEMTNVPVLKSVYNASKATNIAANGSGNYDIVASNAALNDKIIVTVSHTATGVNATKTLTVVPASSVTSIAFGQVSPLANTARITVGHTGLEIPYTLIDQYGKSVKLPAHTANSDGQPNYETIGQVIFSSSAPNVVNPDTFAVDANGKLTFNAGSSSGNAIITALVPATGAYATLSITVNAAPDTSYITINPPAKIARVGSELLIPFTVTDQYGNALDLNSSAWGGTADVDLSIVGDVASSISFGTGVKLGNIVYVPTSTGPKTIYAIVKTLARDPARGTATIAINVDVAAEATTVNYSSAALLTLANGQTVAAGNPAGNDLKFIVTDQDGSPIGLATPGNAGVKLYVYKNDPSAVLTTSFGIVLDGDDINAANGITNGISVTAHNINRGTATVYARLFNDADNDNIMDAGEELPGYTAVTYTVVKPVLTSGTFEAAYASGSGFAQYAANGNKIYASVDSANDVIVKYITLDQAGNPFVPEDGVSQIDVTFTVTNPSTTEVVTIKNAAGTATIATIQPGQSATFTVTTDAADNRKASFRINSSAVAGEIHNININAKPANSSVVSDTVMMVTDKVAEAGKQYTGTVIAFATDNNWILVQTPVGDVFVRPYNTGYSLIVDGNSANEAQFEANLTIGDTVTVIGTSQLLLTNK